VVAGTLRRDEDRRLADALERGAEEVGAAVAGRGCRQAVEEVDDRIARPARRVVGREVDLRPHDAADAAGAERRLDHAGAEAGGRAAREHERRCQEEQQPEARAPHRVECTDPSHVFTVA
jgi:hypothetical protein